MELAQADWHVSCLPPHHCAPASDLGRVLPERTQASLVPAAAALGASMNLPEG